MKHKKTVWLVNHHVSPPSMERHMRTIKIAEYLSIMGYDVIIIGSSFIYHKNVNLITDNSRFIEKFYNNIRFIHIKTKSYNKFGIVRISRYFLFSIKLFLLRNKLNKPDVIFHTAHMPFENLIYFTAKKHNAKYIVELEDLWTHTIVSIGMVRKRNPMLKILYKAEIWLYKRADEIVFNMEGGRPQLHPLRLVSAVTSTRE